MAGVQFDIESAKKIAQVVRQSLGTLPSTGPMQRTRAMPQADRAVILDAALGVATHALTGATSCLATRCIWSPADEEYTETTEQLTVWNHSEAQEYDADTFGLARWIDGHWYFMGDCAAMAAR